MITACMAHLHVSEVALCDGEVRVHVTPHVLPALLPVPVHVGALQGAIERLHAFMHHLSLRPHEEPSPYPRFVVYPSAASPSKARKGSGL